MKYLDFVPFSIPFDFTNVPSALGANIVTQASPINLGDFCVRGITTMNFDGRLPSFNFYRLQWFDAIYGEKMMSDEISMGAFEADSQIPFMFPVPWIIRQGSFLVMSLHNMTAVIPMGIPANVSTQHVLFGELYPQGFNQLDKQAPWMISLYFNLGFQEPTISGGNVVDSFNLYPSFSKTMDPLKYDFELRSITIDALNFISGTNAASFHRLQITDKVTGQTLFDKTAMIGNVAGVRAVEEFTATGLPIPAGFPQNNTIQYELPKPVLFKKNSVINVKLGMCFTYGVNTGQVSNNNGECNVCLMGVRS